ncbi:MAG: Hsp70 family protein [Mycobacterium sp.]
MADGIGLSVGATTLRAVAVGRSAVTRSPVLTRYPHRPAEVGVPSENPNLAERGLIITDFVDRVGDPVPILAGDGSSHRAEDLLADALRALLYALTGGRPPVEPVGVTHPAHWRSTAVDALRAALASMTEFNGATLGGAVSSPIGSDAEAGLIALNDDPGLPTRGIIALCDVGGTGTSVTLADAARGFGPLGPTVRYPDLSGDVVDQALLTRVVADLAAAGTVDLSGTSAIGSLGRLRGQCRAAKERLSTTAVTSIAVELPGHRTEVRVTRAELEDAIAGPLGGLVDVIQDTLQRSGIRPGDLVAVASVGGGARIPILTTTLSEHLRIPVVTSAQPELAAAIGGGLRAARGVVPDGATALSPAATGLAPVDPAPPGSSTFRALAWSDAEDPPEPVVGERPFAGEGFAEEGLEKRGYEPLGEPADPRPRIEFTEPDADDDPALAPLAWYRRPLAIAAIILVAALAVVGAASLYALRSDESPPPESTPTSEAPVTTTPPPPASEVPPQTQAPAPDTVTEQAPPPPVVTVTEEPPPPPPPPAATTEPPPPPPTTTEPPPVTVTETPTTQPPSSTPPTQQPIIPTLPYQTIPGLPFVPAPVQPQSP